MFLAVKLDYVESKPIIDTFKDNLNNKSIAIVMFRDSFIEQNGGDTFIYLRSFFPAYALTIIYSIILLGLLVFGNLKIAFLMAVIFLLINYMRPIFFYWIFFLALRKRGYKNRVEWLQ